MTKRLVDLMGGLIGVESQVGKGSVFWLKLIITTAETPHVGTPDVATKAVPQPSEGSWIATLLYQEDNSTNLMLVEYLIARRPDLRLLSARDGICGVEIKRTALPDVILIDINLPGINGIQAMLILATDVITAHIPLLAMSARSGQAIFKKAWKRAFSATSPSPSESTNL